RDRKSVSQGRPRGPAVPRRRHQRAKSDRRQPGGNPVAAVAADAQSRQGPAQDTRAERGRKDFRQVPVAHAVRPVRHDCVGLAGLFCRDPSPSCRRAGADLRSDLAHPRQYRDVPDGQLQILSPPMADVIPFVVTVLAFGAVAAVVFVVGQYYAASVQLERRLPAAVARPSDVGGGSLHGLPHRVAGYFEATLLGLRSVVREGLRRDLIRAGYFGANPVDNYLFWRLTCLALLPTAVYLGSRLFPADTPGFLAVAVVLLSILVAAA